MNDIFTSDWRCSSKVAGKIIASQTKDQATHAYGTTEDQFHSTKGMIRSKVKKTLLSHWEHQKAMRYNA